MARHEVPKPVKQKKAAPRKRPAKVIALIAHPVAITADIARTAPPAKIPEEHLPEIHAAFYAPDAPEEPHHIVIEAGGKKSLWKRFSDWLEI